MVELVSGPVLDWPRHIALAKPDTVGAYTRNDREPVYFYDRHVVKDIGNAHALRLGNIYENRGAKQIVLISFATRGESPSDAEKFVRQAQISLASPKNKSRSAFHR